MLAPPDTMLNTVHLSTIFSRRTQLASALRALAADPCALRVISCGQEQYFFCLAHLATLGYSVRSQSHAETLGRADNSLIRTTRYILAREAAIAGAFACSGSLSLARSENPWNAPALTPSVGWPITTLTRYCNAGRCRRRPARLFRCPRLHEKGAIVVAAALLLLLIWRSSRPRTQWIVPRIGCAFCQRWCWFVH